VAHERGYVMSRNDRVIVCERGVRAYETYTRNRSI
jgi:3-deoxy-D-arabino-heptulosonate 7-phosphate (DAHP) synthase